MAVLTYARVRTTSIAVAVCLGAAITAFSQAALPPIEASVKAVFLYNFSKYVSFPAPDAAARSPEDIRICVTADDAFFALLRSAVQGERIDGRPLRAVALPGLDETKTCQILYVGNPRSPDGRAWLTAARGHHILTVADGALTDDTVIAFVRDGTRIRFDINRAAAERHRLNISSKLLRLARHVRER